MGKRTLARTTRRRIAHRARPALSQKLVSKTVFNFARDIYAASKLDDLYEEWLAEDAEEKKRQSEREGRTAPASSGKKVGRPELMSFRQLMTLMIILSLSDRAFHLTNVRDLICTDLTKSQLRKLGLPLDCREENIDLWYDRIHRCYTRFRDLVNPYTDIRLKKRIALAHYEKIEAARKSPERQAFITKRRRRVTAMANALAMGSISLLPKGDREKWNGDIAIDATLIEHRRPVKKVNGIEVVSSEPEAGWWRHDTTDHGLNGVKPGDPKYDTRYGFDLTLVAMIFEGSNAGAIPNLICGINLDRPSVAVAENALAALRHIIEDDSMPKGVVVTDRAYFGHARYEKFSLPLRKNGYTMLGSYRITDLGLQARYKGAILVDGWLYCPSMGDNLINATRDFFEASKQKKNENDKSYRERLEVLDALLEERKEYELSLDGKTAAGSIRMTCPALGKNPTVTCTRKPDAMPVPPGVTPLKLYPGPPLSTEAEVKMNPICGNKKDISIPIRELTKFYQEGPRFMTPEWREKFALYRNINESRNAMVKDARFGNLGDKTGRLLRGIVGQSLMAALYVVRTNSKVIINYLERLLETDDPIDPVVKKRKNEIVRDAVDDELVFPRQRHEKPPDELPAAA